MTNRTDTEAAECLQHATDTARRIEAQAAAIALLREHEGESIADIIRDEPEAEQEVRDARDLLELGHKYGSGSEWGQVADVADGLDDACDRLAYESALSFEANGTNSGSGWDIDGATIVLGTGGPHVEIRYRREHASVHIHGWFGAGSCEYSVDPEAVDAVYRVESRLDCLHAG